MVGIFGLVPSGCAAAPPAAGAHLSLEPPAQAASMPMASALPSASNAVAAAGLKTLAASDFPCAVVHGKGVWCLGPSYGGAADQQGVWIAATEAAVELGVGRSFTCVLDTASNVRCFGSTASPEGKNRGATSNPGVYAVDLPVKSSRLVVGQEHACALGTDHNVRCWGDNDWGQSNAEQPGCAKQQTPECASRQHAAPTVASWASGSTQIGVGARFICAVVSNRLRCRGAIDLDQPVPTDFRIGSSSTADFPCGTTSKGVMCFTADRREIALHAPIAIVASEVCGLTDRNVAACIDAASPDRKRELSRLPDDTVELAAGHNFACARTKAGKVQCVGDLPFHRDYIGDVRGTSSWQSFQPIAIGRPTQPTRVEPARVKNAVSWGWGVCALLDDATVVCWKPMRGAEDFIEHPTQRSAVGEIMPDLAGVTELHAGSPPCATNASGTFCWPNGFPERAEKHSASTFEIGSTGVDAQCALKDGTLTCFDRLRKQSHKVEQVSALSHGLGHVCAIAGAERIVKCFGSFYNPNAPGDDSDDPDVPSDSSQFEQVHVAGATQLVSGDHHACALDSARHVACWGDNTYRQLGDCWDAGCHGQRKARAVRGLPPAMRLIADAGFTCAQTLDRRVLCLGNVLTGTAPADGTWTKPHALPPLPAEPRLLTEALCFVSTTDRLFCLGERGRRWREMLVQRVL